MSTQVFKKDFIVERIKDTGFPFWSLGLVSGFKNIANVMQYWGADFEDEDSKETQIEKSINRLLTTLSTFPADSEFQIDLKVSKQANGSGIVGPFLFVNNNDVKESETEKKQQIQLGAIPAGYVPESALKGLEDKLTSDFDLRFERYKAEVEREKREEQFKRREESLIEREKELKELEKAYNSSVAKTADIFIEIGKKIASHFFPQGGGTAVNNIAAPGPALAGPSEDAAQADEKEKAVNELAEFVYNNFDKDNIIKLLENFKNYKNESLLEKQNNESAASATASGDDSGSAANN